MARLKDRNRQIPNGLIFYVPETGWKAPRYPSFDRLVQELIAHRNANAFLRDKHHWATDYATVANEVDAFNAKVCETMGWTDYIVSDGGQTAQVPFPLPLPPQSLSVGKAVVAGGRTLVDWIQDGAQAVPKELAEKRAAQCIACPKHDRGDWTRFFTVPAQDAIRAALNQGREWKLETSKDAELRICSACLCPMRLKVHVPAPTIRAKMPPEAFNELVPECWIKTETEPT